MNVKQTILRVVAVSAVLAMVGCTQIPLSSLWALRKFDMAQIDGGALRALVYLPEGAATLRDAIKVPLKIERGNGSPDVLEETLGAMLIGVLTGEAGQAAMKPFSVDLFKGMLAFFLLDMGLLAARNMGKLKGQSVWLLVYAIAGPMAHAGIALVLGWVLGMSSGNVALLMVLAASASYIAVPAVIRHAIPEANPSLYFGMSLGLTFPFNILIGIPLYVHVAKLYL